MSGIDTHALRILTVTNMWPEDGDFRGIFVREQVAAIRALGHRVDVEVVGQARGRRDYVLAAARVRRRVRRGDYDVVHVHFGMTAFAARFAGRVPRVLTLHGGDIHVPWQRLITKLTWAGTTRIYTSARLARSAGDPGGTVIACGVDPALFAPSDRSAARAVLGIDHDEPIVLFGASPANPVKDHPLFTAVLTDLRARGLPVHELVLAERGAPRERVAAKFHAADALLVTSRRGTETGPLVVKEAVLAGLPVVSVDVGDVPEVLAGVTPSVCVPWPQPWGTGAARAALVTALADRLEEVLAIRARSNGPALADRLSLSTSARAVVDVYRRVLADHQPRRRRQVTRRRCRC